MAGAYAVAAVGKSILAVLESACPRAELPTADFELYQAKNFLRPMEEGIALYLYRIAPASGVRSTPPRSTPEGLRYKPSLSLDLHYLLIPFAHDAFKQQRLLGWAMRTLEDQNVLSASLLNSQSPESDLFTDSESIQVSMEPLSIHEMSSVWEVARPNIQPAVGYVARVLMLDSSVTISGAPEVRSRQW